MLLRALWNPLGLVLGALGRLLAALVVLMRPLGGTPVFQNFIWEATGHRILRGIMASRSRASSQSLYGTYFCIDVSFLAHPLLPNHYFPYVGASRGRF